MQPTYEKSTQSGHSGYYFLDIGVIIAGAVLCISGNLVLGAVLFIAGCFVHFDWLGLGILK